MVLRVTIWRFNFVIRPSFRSSPNDKMLPSLKQGMIYLLKSTQRFGTHYFVTLGKLCNLKQQCRDCATSTWIYTHQHMSNYEFQQLGCTAFECRSNFQTNWESFAHRDQQNMQGFAAPKPWRWQMSNSGLWTGSIINQSRAHSHIWTNRKITSSIESKSFMWQNIVDSNTNKRSSWNNHKPSKLVSKGLKLLTTKLWSHRTLGG